MDYLRLLASAASRAGDPRQLPGRRGDCLPGRQRRADDRGLLPANPRLVRPSRLPAGKDARGRRGGGVGHRRPRIVARPEPVGRNAFCRPAAPGRRPRPHSANGNDSRRQGAGVGDGRSARWSRASRPIWPSWPCPTATRPIRTSCSSIRRNRWWDAIAAAQIIRQPVAAQRQPITFHFEQEETERTEDGPSLLPLLSPVYYVHFCHAPESCHRLLVPHRSDGRGQIGRGRGVGAADRCRDRVAGFDGPVSGDGHRHGQAHRRRAPPRAASPDRRARTARGVQLGPVCRGGRPLRGGNCRPRPASVVRRAARRCI